MSNLPDGIAHDKLNESKMSAIQGLGEYINDSNNHLYLFIEDITRRVKAAQDETKQLSAKLESHTKEKKVIEKRLVESEKERQRYRRERNAFKAQFEKFRQEVQNPSYDQEEQLRREFEELQNTYEQKDKEWERKLKESEEKRDEIIKVQNQKIETFERDVKLQSLKIKNLEEILEKRKSDVENREDNKTELNDTNEKLHHVMAKLKETEKELDETKTRLSKAMGEKLTDNNPNIADLSDKNRPTKLAERYAEMYDNQWTDAFEKLENYFRDDKDIIEILLTILQDVMEFCKRKAKSQMDDLKRAVSYSGHQVERSIPNNIIKQLKDCRKAMATVSKDNVSELFLSQLESAGGKHRYALKVDEFVEECIEICWNMAIQDPPVIFGPMAARGDVLDTDVYKPYTSSGRYVKFIVWPALFLHEDGPVLAKGVAQGYGETLHKRKEAWVYNAKNPKLANRVEEEELDKYLHGRSSHGRITSHETYGSSTQTDREHIDPTVEKTRYYTRSGTNSHHRTRNAEEMTARISAKPFSAGTSRTPYEREPTPSEMNIFFRFYESRDFIKARNVLGAKVYERCWQKAYDRYKYR